jgi:hypothetical protein
VRSDANTPEDFWRRLAPGAPEECWPWPGALATGGYGTCQLEGRQVRAHRAAYQLTHGAIPKGLVLDHLCRNRACCNPAHLEPVTIRENNLRGVGVTSTNVAKTHCPQGHPYSGDNLFRRFRQSGWTRECWACRRAAEKRKGLAIRGASTSTERAA